MKFKEICFVAKQHKDDYVEIEKHLTHHAGKVILNKEKIIENDCAYEIHFSWEEDGVYHLEFILASNMKELLDYVKEHNPGLCAQIPEFNTDKFEFIANNAKASTGLRCTPIETNTGVEDFEKYVLSHFGEELEIEDITGEYATTMDFIKSVIEKGCLTELYCYPHTPVGFWNYYGVDFQTLLDHVVED